MPEGDTADWIAEDEPLRAAQPDVEPDLD
jgi:hypothetical protein